MLNEILCTDYYVMYNYKLAEMWGLNEAIIFNELANMCQRARETKTGKSYDTKYFFPVDLEYIKKRTTIPVDDIRAAVNKLIDLSILRLRNQDTHSVSIDVEKVVGYISSNDESLINDFNKLSNKTNKNEFALKAIIRHIQTTDPELKVAYEKWLRAIENKRITATFIECEEQRLHELCAGNKEKELWILRYATGRCWKTLDPAIEKYKEEHSGIVTFTEKKQEINNLANEVF